MSQNKEDSIIYIEHNETSDCEFVYNFSKSVIFDESYSCALLECNLPKNIKVDKFKHPKKLFLNCVWVENFDPKLFEKSDKLEYFHKQTSDDFKDMVYEYTIGPEIHTEEEYLQEVQKIKIEENIKTFYESRFKDAYGTFIKDTSLFLPSIVVENKRFRNNPGELRFHGIYIYDSWKLEAGHQFMEKEARIADFFRLKSSDFYKNPVAFVFFTFDEEMHKILGYDRMKFPVAKYMSYKEGYILKHKVDQHNNGIAVFKSEFSFDMIYLHLNIVKESFIQDKKANILRVFSKKPGSHREMVNYIFEYPVFIPLRIHEIDSMRFKITNSYDEIATCKEGFISMKIIFKSIQF
jgi:hypothetical protein